MELVLWLILATLVVGFAFIGFMVNIISGQLQYIITHDPDLKYKEPEWTTSLSPREKP